MKTLSEHPLAFKIHCFSLVCLQMGFQGTLQDDSTFLENLPEFFCRFIEFQADSVMMSVRKGTQELPTKFMYHSREGQHGERKNLLSFFADPWAFGLGGP